MTFDLILTTFVQDIGPLKILNRYPVHNQALLCLLLLLLIANGRPTACTCVSSRLNTPNLKTIFNYQHLTHVVLFANTFSYCTDTYLYLICLRTESQFKKKPATSFKKINIHCIISYLDCNAAFLQLEQNPSLLTHRCIP